MLLEKLAWSYYSGGKGQGWNKAKQFLLPPCSTSQNFVEVRVAKPKYLLQTLLDTVNSFWKNVQEKVGV